MADRFDIQRRLDTAAERVASGARRHLDDEREAERARIKRLVRLGVGYYFDPLDKVVLRKSGSRYIFVRHDRRGGTARKSQAHAELRQFHLITGGLFWDDKAKKLYRKTGQHYVLYSPDRRKMESASHAGQERRAKRA